MLTCQKCGHENELGRIFCHQCGTKLDLSQIKPPAAKKRRRPGPGAGRLVWRAVELAVLVLIVWGIYSMAQVPTVRITRSTDDDFVSVERKRRQLEGLVEGRKPAAVLFSEAELNAFARNYLKFEKSKGSGLNIEGNRVELEVGEGVLKVNLFGEVKVGGKFNRDFYVSLTGIPKVQDNRFTFVPVAAAIGKLPIHPLILQHTGVVQRYYTRLFKGLTHEKKLLDRLTSISVEHSASGRGVRLEYQPQTTGN